MEHATVISLLDLFISGGLSPFETFRVFRHLKSCASCREELEMRLLVQMAAGTVETKDPYDLKGSLEELYRARHRKLVWMFVLLLFLLVLLAAAVIVFVFVLERQ